MFTHNTEKDVWLWRQTLMSFWRWKHELKVLMQGLWKWKALCFVLCESLRDTNIKGGVSWQILKTPAGAVPVFCFKNHSIHIIVTCKGLFLSTCCHVSNFNAQKFMQYCIQPQGGCSAPSAWQSVRWKPYWVTHLDHENDSKGSFTQGRFSKIICKWHSFKIYYIQ